MDRRLSQVVTFGMWLLICDENGIEYIGTLDVLTIAMNKGIFTSDECNRFMAEAKAKNKAKFPVDDITVYQAPEYISTF